MYFELDVDSSSLNLLISVPPQKHLQAADKRVYFRCPENLEILPHPTL